MKHLTITLLTLLLSMGAWAEWTLATENEAGDKFYIDFDSIEFKEEKMYVWLLNDYAVPTIYGHLSMKVKYEVDCQTPVKDRYLSNVFYEGAMGKGKIMRTLNETGEWYYVKEETSASFLYSELCSLKDFPLK